MEVGQLALKEHTKQWGISEFWQEVLLINIDGFDNFVVIEPKYI